MYAFLLHTRSIITTSSGYIGAPEQLLSVYVGRKMRQRSREWVLTHDCSTPHNATAVKCSHHYLRGLHNRLEGSNSLGAAAFHFTATPSSVINYCNFRQKTAHHSTPPPNITENQPHRISHSDTMGASTSSTSVTLADLLSTRFAPTQDAIMA